MTGPDASGSVMRGRRDTTIDRHRFPVDPWRLVETVPGDGSLADAGLTETLFAVGNGFLGVRSAPLDGTDGESPGVIVNGLHETWTIEYAENAYGLARHGQTVVSAPDALALSVLVDGRPIEGAVAEHDRTVDLRSGVLVRDTTWVTERAGRVRVRSELLVSLSRRHVAATRIEVSLLDHPGVVTIGSSIRNRQDERLSTPGATAGSDPRRGRVFGHRVLEPRLARRELPDDPDGGVVTAGFRCAQSGMIVACSQRHTVEAGRFDVGADGTELTTRLAAGQTAALTKFVAYHTDVDGRLDDSATLGRDDVDAAWSAGWSRLVDEQHSWLGSFWAHSDVVIDGDPAAQQATRWNLFQLAQSTARAGGLGVAAKGVTAGGYDGHYFWDTEIYVIPFLAATNPPAARELLEFRASLLPAARQRAAEMSQRGALYPWRTITGEEASAYYPAGTAQYHIDAAVAHAIDRYVAATGDITFLAEHGAEMSVEIARLFADLGCYDRGDPPAFHLHGVTGPDEYTAVVDDNVYTNLMARFSLRLAADAVELVERSDPAAHRRLLERTGLTADEPVEWRRIADAMHVAYDTELGIHPQDASFLSHEPWDFDGVPADRYPLLLNFHPLVIYRHQVLKQADVVLATFLRPEAFTPDEQRRDFDFYDPLTTGDSSLSACVQAIVAAQVGHRSLGHAYFEQSLYLDLADTHGNARDGVHIANAGGVWAALVHGFGGVRDAPDALHVQPRLPDGWRSLRFRVRRRGTTIEILAEPSGATVTAIDGECPVADGDTVTHLAAGGSLRLATR